MLNLSGIQADSIVDGPGIRTTFFCQGCPHHCKGCHNPETWPFEGGTPMDTDALVEIVTSNPLCRGVTFSGGEPFAQAEGYLELAKALKEKGYNTNKIRTEGLLSQSTLQKFRNQQGVSWENLETLCRLLDCQPADLIEYVKEPVEGVQ